VPIDVINDMLGRWDSNFTIDDVLKSRAPWENFEQYEGLLQETRETNP